MRLTQPNTAFHASWLEACHELQHADGPNEGHGMSLELADGDLSDPARFTAWVSTLNDEALYPRPGRVPATNWWMVEGSEYLGAIQLRHTLGTEYLRTHGGHVGYTVRPSARGRGLATQALTVVLTRAHEFGLDQVMVTCLEANPASARVIEKAGGVIEGTSDGLRRYWIPTQTK